MSGMERAIRVMIVDDEYMVLNTLREEVPWNELGMELVAEASNGRQALEKCAAYWPDLILIDISMPDMNGLETIRTARTDFPAARFAILTAHQDFEYAQKALHLGALAYVLKTPVLIDDMKRMLLDCRKTIEAEREADKRLRMADQLLNRHSLEIRQSILHDLLRGGNIPEQDWKYLLEDDSAARPDADRTAMQAMHIFVLRLNRMLSRYPEPDVPLIKFSIFQAVQEVVAEAGGGIALPDASGSVFAIRSVPSSGSRAQAEADAHRIYSRLHRFFRQYFGVDIAVGISSVSEDREKLPRLLKESAIASSMAFYRTPASLYYFHEAKALDRRMADWPAVERAIASKWRSPLIESRLDGLRLLKDYVRERMPEPALLKNKVLAVLEEADIRLTRRDLREINDNGCQADWSEVLEELLVRSFDRTSDASTGQELHEEVGKAIEFIQRNLQDNLTLVKVAEHIHMNPSYFSHLFKMNTGSTFIDYLTKLRMERAKQLLLGQEMKSHKLCEQIGFSSYPHFCTQFKKITGMTPSEYKQQAKLKSSRPSAGSV